MTGIQNDGEVVLAGLDGTNPLGFLAAIGTLRLLSLNADHETRMSWKQLHGSWRPAFFKAGLDLKDMGALLRAAVSMLDKSAWSLDKKLPFAAAQLRAEALSAASVATVHNRDRVDLIAALGVDCFTDDNGNFKDTALRMVRAGDAAGQGLLAYGKRILEVTTSDEIQSATTEAWRYDDKQCALRWDPAEDRGYAFQWGNPSDDGAQSVRGANCLALAALSLLPTVPFKGRVETTAFGLKAMKKSSFTWPIWGGKLTLNSVRSALSLKCLQEAEPLRTELASRGIVASYRCDRVMTSTYYSNFTPALRIA